MALVLVLCCIEPEVKRRTSFFVRVPPFLQPLPHRLVPCHNVYKIMIYFVSTCLWDKEPSSVAYYRSFWCEMPVDIFKVEVRDCPALDTLPQYYEILCSLELSLIVTYCILQSYHCVRDRSRSTWQHVLTAWPGFWQSIFLLTPHSHQPYHLRIAIRGVCVDIWQKRSANRV